MLSIFEYIATMVAAGHVLAPPTALQTHIYARYLPAPKSEVINVVPDADDDTSGLERLDPVCLMDVDPATANYALEHNGRIYYFCAPGCKKAFERNSQDYVLET